MLAQKEIVMKLLKAVVVGLMIGGPVFGQEKDAVPIVSDEDELSECLSLVEQGEKVTAVLKIALGFEDQEKCQEALDQQELELKVLQVSKEQQRQALEQRNNSLIDRDILAACTELFDEQRTMAMTNTVCVRAFRQLGHPKLKR
jgi:hypothetical protein